MTRTIRLSRIHALNWYGYRDSIPVQGNILLAGLTGSGKSILMDLIQFVLVGDQRHISFNQSATGGRSGRTLKGYCLGDTKEEDNGGATQYMRQSAVTYAALEFTWPDGSKKETWGLRVEFTSTAETHGKVVPFFIPNELSRSDFLDPQKRPLDHAAFKAMVEGQGGRIYMEGVEAYLRDMSQPVHLNYERQVVRSLLPTAMSFTFLKNFNDFCRKFILPFDKLDVKDVADSYRTFVTYEQELGRLNDQLIRLLAIREDFQRRMELQRDRDIAGYLSVSLSCEHATEQLSSDEDRLKKLTTECAYEEKRLTELEVQIGNLRSEIAGLNASINETTEGKLYNELKLQKKKLISEVDRFNGIERTLEGILASRISRAQGWVDDVRGLCAEGDESIVDAAETGIQTLRDGGVFGASENIVALTTQSQDVMRAVEASTRPVQTRLVEVRRRQETLKIEIAALKVGKFPFPTHLLDELNSRLVARGAGLPAVPISKLCEVTDEKWRPAVEVAFSEKFAIKVPQEQYEEAEAIYHGLTAQQLRNEGHVELLVDAERAMLLASSAYSGSLAEKIQTGDSVTRALVDTLFGNLMCVERREDLSSHDFAILPDGFMRRGAFVGRLGFYDGSPYVGKRGLEQQLASKNAALDDLSVEERKLSPIDQALTSISARWVQLFAVPTDLSRDLQNVLQLPRLQADLTDCLTKLAGIDNAKFEALEAEQGKREAILKQSENEQRSLDRSEKRGLLKSLTTEIVKTRDHAQRLQANLAEKQKTVDLSGWQDRLEELRTMVLAKHGGKLEAAKGLEEMYHECDRSEATVWSELKAKREKLALLHNRFQDLAADGSANDEYDNQLVRLEQNEIPRYAEKSKREKRNWEELFRVHVLEKLYQALSDVKNQVILLNDSLKKRPIGNHRYRIQWQSNPEFAVYQELLTANAASQGDGLFFESAEPQYREAIDHLLKTLTSEPNGSEAERLLDHRYYYNYDLEVVEEDGRKTSVDRQSDKFSGGENQSPYFIAILASYLRAYRRYGGGRGSEPTLGLVPIDEAFSKLSGERIKDCISALKALDLQGVFSMSTGNILYGLEHCDWLLVVSKEEKRMGKKTDIRNTFMSVARESEEAMQLIRSEETPTSSEDSFASR